MTWKIKFEEAMKARIEKMHRPVVDSAEDLQKTEISGIFCAMSDYSEALIDVHNEVLSMLFNREFERTHGLLDKQDVLKVMTALDRTIRASFARVPQLDMGAEMPMPTKPRKDS